MFGLQLALLIALSHLNPLTVFFAVCNAVLYLVVFAFTVYLDIPVQLGGGGIRIFSFIISDTAIQEAIAGESFSEVPLVSPVLAETAEIYILPAAELATNRYTPMQKITFEEAWTGTYRDANYVHLPKSAVRVATALALPPNITMWPRLSKRVRKARLQGEVKRLQKLIDSGVATVEQSQT
jgi:hypothetical protein